MCLVVGVHVSKDRLFLKLCVNSNINNVDVVILFNFIISIFKKTSVLLAMNSVSAYALIARTAALTLFLYTYSNNALRLDPTKLYIIWIKLFSVTDVPRIRHLFIISHTSFH